ncbi:MAG: response regulator [Patescibacteria group bacterium]
MAKKTERSSHNKTVKSSILLIEDEPMICDVYQAAFRKTPYKFLIARNKEEGMAAIFSKRPLLILLDLMIPISNDLVIEYDHPVGFDLLEMIKQSDVTHDAHVFIITNSESREHEDHAKRLGVDKFFIKANTTPQTLVREVIKVLG